MSPDADRGRGRPRMGPQVSFQLEDQDQLVALDDWAADHDVTRAEAIRRMIAYVVARSKGMMTALDIAVGGLPEGVTGVRWSHTGAYECRDHVLGRHALSFDTPSEPVNAMAKPTYAVIHDCLACAEVAPATASAGDEL